MAVCLTHRYRWPRNLGELLQDMHFNQKNMRPEETRHEQRHYHPQPIHLPHVIR